MTYWLSVAENPHFTLLPESQQHISSVCSAATSRGVLILPGLGNCRADYDPLSAALQAKGLSVEIADVARVDWLRNAAGLRDPEYWKGNLNPRPTVDWYLNKVDAAARALQERSDGAPLTLLTHSAGGWLGRLYLLDYGTQKFDRMVSLGSPHNPPPEGVIDQTRGILTFCESACPGAHHDEIAYITIAGKFIKGAPIGGPGTLAQRIAGLGYAQVCGRADVWGDSIVPLPTAHLDGAINVDLEGVYHSPLGSSDSAEGIRDGGRPWYGSTGILEQWFDYLTGDPETLTSTVQPLPGATQL